MIYMGLNDFNRNKTFSTETDSSEKFQGGVEETIKMDVKKVFRKLVTNQFSCVEDVGYFGQRFSFRTAFSKTAYSYCCCNCAFEHEYLGYISDNGHIHEAVYEKIVKSIIDGQCPHVVKVSREHLRETSIYGIHIATSVAIEKKVRYHAKNYQTIKTGIFKLNPHALAVIKSKSQDESLYYLHFPKLLDLFWISEPILYASRSNNNIIKIEEMDSIEMCVQKRNVHLLQKMLDHAVVHMGLPKAFEFTMKHNLKDLQDMLLEYTCTSKVTYKFYFAESAIMYNKPHTLDRILRYRSREPFQPSSGCKLSELCTVLMRDKCKRVLSKHGMFQSVEIKFDDKMFAQLHRLDRFYADFKTEIVTYLKLQLMLQPRDCSNNISKCFYRCFTIQPVRTDVLEVLLRLGADVNYTDDHHNTPMVHMLHHLCQFNPSLYMGCARKAMELLIYENPNIDLHEVAVYLGLQEDARLQSLKYKKEIDVVGSYRADAKEHGLFGHDDPYDFALNFMGPLLIECGFPVTRSMLLESLDKPLHPAEHAYIKDFLDYPRPLKTHCRNTLRKFFKGRNIHMYLESVECHQKLKDFVLLESACLSI